MGIAAALKELFISNAEEQDTSLEVGQLEAKTKRALEQYINELNTSSKKSAFGSSLKVEKNPNSKGNSTSKKAEEIIEREDETR